MSPGGPAAEVLNLLARDEHAVVVSPILLSELYDVLRRPNVRHFHQLSDAKIRRAVSRLYTASSVIGLPPDIPAIVTHDPKDDPIVLTALLGKADVLCTLDRHLHAEAVITFCTGHGIRVLKDLELLNELRNA